MRIRLRCSLDGNFFYLAFLSSVTVYDTGKIFANNIGRTFYLFKRYSGIPSGSVALFALNDLTILLMSFLEAGGKVKTQGGWPKVFSNRYNAAMFLESFTDFCYCRFILALGIRIAD